MEWQQQGILSLWVFSVLTLLFYAQLLLLRIFVVCWAAGAAFAFYVSISGVDNNNEEEEDTGQSSRATLDHSDEIWRKQAGSELSEFCTQKVFD